MATLDIFQDDAFSVTSLSSTITDGSPVSDGGRGLKLAPLHRLVASSIGSPVSDGGRGLKQQAFRDRRIYAVVRPSAMAGVD